PLQALVTLNDPQFVEAARALAQSVLGDRDCDGACDRRIDAMARRVLARPLRSEERPIVQASLAKLEAFYRSHPDEATKLITVGESRPDPALDRPTLAAWTMLANELMNLDEFLNK